jgi:hypothetical protein
MSLNKRTMGLGWALEKAEKPTVCFTYERGINLVRRTRKNEKKKSSNLLEKSSMYRTARTPSISQLCAQSIVTLLI